MSGALCGDEMREARRVLNGEARWCFHCRDRRDFERITRVPVRPSYHDPFVTIECTVCHTPDGDLFPGRCREWGYRWPGGA